MAALLPTAGDLNRRIHIRVQTDTPDGQFGLTQTFSTGFWRWAKREPVHSLALRADMNTGEQATDLFWVRWGTNTKPTDLTTSNVIEHGGRRFRVLDSIDVDDRHEFTRISAKDLGPV